MTLAVIVILLQIADAVTTVIGIRKGLRELNPILLFFKEHLPGWWWLIVPKLVGVALAVLLGMSDHAIATGGLIGLCFWYLFVVHRNIDMIRG